MRDAVLYTPQSPDFYPGSVGWVLLGSSPPPFLCAREARAVTGWTRLLGWGRWKGLLTALRQGVKQPRDQGMRNTRVLTQSPGFDTQKALQIAGEAAPAADTEVQPAYDYRAS